MTLLIAGCDATPPATARAARSQCTSRPGGSRWAVPAEYSKTAAFGRREDAWITEAAGVAVHDSLVFVYDAPEARVTVLTNELVPRRRFGRRGGGPGEMNSFTSRGILGPQWNWLALSGDTLLVFDGVAVHRFMEDGRFVGRAYQASVERMELTDGTSVLAVTGGRLLAAAGGYDIQGITAKGDQRYRWTLLDHAGRGPRPLVSLRLAPLPARGGGAPFEGPEQARPVWGASADCVVATDGGGGWMVRARLDGTGIDTLEFPLPELPLPRVDRDEIARLSGMASKGQDDGYLEPSRMLRVKSLVVDPDGYAWVLPAQDSAHAGAGVEIVRVSLADGSATRDTVPAFPLVFGRPGVFYARTNNPFTGEAEVVRYEAAKAGGG